MGVGAGDVLDVRIVGEDKLPTAFTVAPDGTVDLPYIDRISVDGLEPQQIADALRAKLTQGEILTDPSVSVSVKEYASKRVEVLGEVQKPGSISATPGMTLLRVIALAGGFNSIARKSAVTLRRRTRDGTAVVVVDVEAILTNRSPDVVLQPGDSVFVPQRIA
jgi:polysaccharide export outer membrane protein